MIAGMRQPGDQVQPAQVHERQLLLGRLLIAFCDQVSCLVKEGKAVDVIYLDFRKAFGSVSHSTPGEAATHGLHRCTLRWVRNWLKG